MPEEIPENPRSSPLQSDLKRLMERHAVRYRMPVAFGILLLGCGIALFILSEPLARVLFRTGLVWAVPLQITAGVLFISGLGAVVMSYLRGDFLRVPDYEISFSGGAQPTTLETSSSSYSASVASFPLLAGMQKELDKVKSDIATLQISEATGRQAQDITKLRESLAAEIASDIERRLSAEALAKVQVQEIRSSFANAYTRLAQALQEISRRGNLNLTIGGITTAVGAASLGYLAFSSPPVSDLKSILVHYIPRLSVVIFLEVFAFFFLRLYKTTLDDSKFYQVELIALATTDIALQAALKLERSHCYGDGDKSNRS